MPSQRHYFSRTAESAPDTFTYRLEFAGRSYDWVSAHGVFSKEQLDFGSRLLLETAVSPPGGRILDLGCGTGSLGLLALATLSLAPDPSASRPESPTWACLSDVSDHALACARQNRARLGLTASAGLVQAELLTAFKTGVFDTVLFNPPIRAGKAPILETLAEMPRVLRPGGTVWVVVRIQQGAKSLLAHLEQVFPGRARAVARRKGYLVLRAGGPTTDDMSAHCPETGGVSPPIARQPPEPVS